MSFGYYPEAGQAQDVDDMGPLPRDDIEIDFSDVIADLVARCERAEADADRLAVVDGGKALREALRLHAEAVALR